MLLNYDFVLHSAEVSTDQDQMCSIQFQRFLIFLITIVRLMDVESRYTYIILERKTSWKKPVLNPMQEMRAQY